MTALAVVLVVAGGIAGAVQAAVMGKFGERVGTLWVIEEGLHPGERVVVEGVQKVRPGMAVHPTPFVAEPTKTGGN